jgi:hypothetical protein
MAVHGKILLAIVLGTLGAAKVHAQQDPELNAKTVTAVASEFDSLLALGDPVGLEDILATDFYREIVLEGQVTPVKQSRSAFLASITHSLSESDVSLGHKRSPFAIHFSPSGDDAEVQYTVVDQAVTPEGTNYIATIETVLHAAIRQGQVKVVSVQSQTGYKNKE